MEPRDLSAHTEYVPGRGVEEVARELGMDPEELVKLASNENPLGPSPEAIEAVREHASRVHSYPKTSHADLVDALAGKWDLESEQVWLAPGGDGALDYLSRATLDPEDCVLVPTPGFAYYGMSARFHHGEVDEHELPREGEQFSYGADAVLSAYEGQRIVYVTSPHNPTGAEMTLDGIELVAEETAESTLVVVDEAYGEFSARESAVELVRQRDDVAVLRTFSKAYGLAGLRLGYALVPEAWADAYARVNTPFAANELGCRAGLAALDDDEHVEQSVHVANWAREYMQDAVVAPVHDSGGNFVLVEVGDADLDAIAAESEINVEEGRPATAVCDALERRGVIVRDCTSFGLPECIRITCGTENETRRAVRELNEVLQA